MLNGSYIITFILRPDFTRQPWGFSWVLGHFVAGTGLQSRDRLTKQEKMMIDDKLPSVDAMWDAEDVSSLNDKSELPKENSSRRSGLSPALENVIPIIGKEINFAAYSSKCDTFTPQRASRKDQTMAHSPPSERGHRAQPFEFLFGWWKTHPRGREKLCNTPDQRLIDGCIVR